MMHPNTIKETRILRKIIVVYDSEGDAHKRTFPIYYTQLGETPGDRMALDETGNVKLSIIKGLLKQLNLDVKFYTWIGGKVILDINIINQAK